MPQTPAVTTAVVREVPSTFAHCIRSDPRESIDVGLARTQHDAYCDALTRCGVDLVRIAADDGFPDCCFVEDPVLVVDDILVVPNVGAPSRRGESEAVRAALGQDRRIVEIGEPAMLEGGDVIRIDDTFYVGLGARSNPYGVNSLQACLEPLGYRVVSIELHNTLHLKSVCAYLGGGHIVWCPGHFDPSSFSGYEAIEIPERDAYSVNCVALNGVVIVAEGFAQTRGMIEASGFVTLEVPVTEFRKTDGGLSCLSVRLEEKKGALDRNQNVPDGV